MLHIWGQSGLTSWTVADDDVIWSLRINQTVLNENLFTTFIVGILHWDWVILVRYFGLWYLWKDMINSWFSNALNREHNSGLVLMMLGVICDKCQVFVFIIQRGSYSAWCPNCSGIKNIVTLYVSGSVIIYFPLNHSCQTTYCVGSSQQFQLEKHENAPFFG